MADLDPEILLAELKRLNDGISVLNQNSQKLVNTMREHNRRMKVVGLLTRQIFILNNILLKTSKVAGMSGMIGSLIDGIARAARQAR